ncbi:oligosaccharyl transferase alpha subunit [Peniophora sp. CONT]|nr:oligosaccharyl transferase alpha subunit [Peniophora sp. CONT]
MHWRHLPLALLGLVAHVCAQFENTAIVRTIEPAGALTLVTTTYAVKVLEENQNAYLVTMSKREGKRTSLIEARLKGKSDTLQVIHKGVQAGFTGYAVVLPTGLEVNSTVDLVVERILSRATYPWPASASQTDPQLMKFEGDLFITSPYHTHTQRTKVRAPTPRIEKYAKPDNIPTEYQTDNVVTKSGATITYGPYVNIPPSSIAWTEEHQQPISVQYHYDFPVVEITTLERNVEISHWGANVNIQDEIQLRNAGPELKGQFSRVQHQMGMFRNELPPHVLPAYALSLPAGARDVYFTDLNGNVSTSRFRSAPSVAKGSVARQQSYLEVRPRFPVMGGWNYFHTLGWDQPLADVAAYDPANGTYFVGVPLLTPITGSAVKAVNFTVTLPEGATDVEFWPPYQPKGASFSTHITYLDTVGRPSITLQYSDLTDRHTKLFYVKYKVPSSAHIQKVRTVASAFFVLFAFGFVARRMNFNLSQKKTV